jgi:hypothetical protein
VSRCRRCDSLRLSSTSCLTGPGFARAFFLLTRGGNDPGSDSAGGEVESSLGEVLLVIILALLVVTVLGVLVRRA